MENQTIVVSGISNREFLERLAQPGRVGLCGGGTRVDIAIRRAQRHLHAAGVELNRKIQGHVRAGRRNIKQLKRRVKSNGR